MSRVRIGLLVEMDIMLSRRLIGGARFSHTYSPHCPRDAGEVSPPIHLGLAFKGSVEGVLTSMWLTRKRSA